MSRAKPAIFADNNYWSDSRLGLLFKCGVAYEFSYIQGIKIPPSIAAVRGTGYHRGVQSNFEQKKTTHVDLPTAHVVEIAVESFKAECSGGITLSDEERSIGKTKVMAQATDSLVQLADVYTKSIAPQYQPVYVEEPFRISLGKRDLVGVIDLADDRDIIVDSKTASKKKSQADADDSLQLTIYKVGFEAKTGRAPAELRLEVAVGTPAGNASHQQLTTNRTDDDLIALANRIDAAERVLESGAFTPAPPGSWWCSKKWCGYYGICPYVNHQRSE